MSERDPLNVMHLRDMDTSIGYVIRGQDDEGNLVVDIAEAICGPRDMFCRKTARRILRGRLECEKPAVPHVERGWTIQADIPRTGNDWKELNKEVLQRYEDLCFGDAFGNHD